MVEVILALIVVFFLSVYITSNTTLNYLKLDKSYLPLFASILSGLTVIILTIYSGFKWMLHN